MTQEDVHRSLVEFTKSTVRRALFWLVTIVAVAIAIITLRSCAVESSVERRFDELERKIDGVAQTTDATKTTAEETQETVQSTQSAIAEGPTVDIEVRETTSAVPSASAKPKAVVVIRPRPKPSAAPSASALPSVEIPIEIPSSKNPEHRR